jgi:ribosomal-protein-alanine N-acetyltransferase
MISPTSLNTEIVIQPMNKRHVRAVRVIDKQVYPKPWSVGMYHDELKQPANRIYLVASQNGLLVGYGGAMLVHDEGHITSIAVNPNAQGNQIATRLLWGIHRGCQNKEAASMTLEVRVSNERAQALYRRFGYVPAGVRAKYYGDNNEDALIMWCHDIQETEHTERLAELKSQLTGLTTWSIA